MVNFWLEGERGEKLVSAWEPSNRSVACFRGENSLRWWMSFIVVIWILRGLSWSGSGVGVGAGLL